jgi:hypothetical protein
VHVEQRQVERQRAHQPERLEPGLGLHDLEPPRQEREEIGDPVTEVAVVVGDQDAVVDLHGRSGGAGPGQDACRSRALAGWTRSLCATRTCTSSPRAPEAPRPCLIGG